MKIVRASSGRSILRVSTKEWISIGVKHGWIKASSSDPVLIDGQWYSEDDEGNVVAVAPPVSKQPEAAREPRQKHFSQYDVTFKEGEKYSNWYGTYDVMKINDDGTMDVRYDQTFRADVSPGAVKRYPMVAQAETIFNARRRDQAEIARTLNLNTIQNFSGNNDYLTLGYIAAHGKISAEVPPKYHDVFPGMYKRVTGENASDHQGEGYALSNNPDWWSYTLRVHLPETSKAALEKLKLPPYRTTGGEIRINNNAFVWGLLNAGFRLGDNRGNAEAIESSIPEDGREAFRTGMAIS